MNTEITNHTQLLNDESEMDGLLIEWTSQISIPLRIELITAFHEPLYVAFDSLTDLYQNYAQNESR